jgi:hypothetical protein
MNITLRICTAVVIYSLVVFDALPAPTDSSKTSVKAKSEAQGSLTSLIRELQSTIDRSQFDLFALLEALEYDSQLIIEFVKEQISFEQYPGVLRGAQGVLMSRSGNSIDQSLLLATLLNDAGYKARIKRGTLSAEEARQLINSISQPAEIQSPFSDFDRASTLVARIHDSLDISLAELNTYRDADTEKGPGDIELLRRNAKHRSLVGNALRESGLELGNPRLMAELVEEARDYFWVEYQSGQATAWESIHPAVAGPIEFRPTIITTYDGDLPPALQQRLRIAAKVERSIGGKLTTHSLMTPFERPVANLNGRTLIYSNVFLRKAEDGEVGNNSRALMAFPFLNGRIAASGQAFDLKGNVIPADAAGSFMAGVFEAVNSKLLDATDALNMATGGKDSESMKLTRAWIEITLLKPYETKPETFTRVLLVPADDSRLSRTPNHRTAITIFTGNIPLSLILDNALSSISQALAEDGESDGADQFVAYYYAFLSGIWNYKNPSSWSYLSEPSLFALHNEVVIEGKTYTGFDVINNTRRAFEGKSKSVQPSVDAAIDFGVWETVVESWLASQMFSETSVSVVTELEQSALAADHTAVKLVAPRKRGPTSQIGQSSMASSLQASDLEEGFAILIPNPKVTQESDSRVWWRINPSSGETLGRAGPTGWGAALKEYDVLLELEQWLACFATIEAKCQENVGWAVGVTGVLIGTSELYLDSPGSVVSWWEMIKIWKDHPYVTRLRNILETKSGVSLDSMSPQEWINKCIVENVQKSKDEGGCED